MSGTTIVKLGGAAITKKDVFETLDEETLSSAALHLASVPGRLVVVHGAGSFGHFQAGEYGVSRGPITDARVLKGFCLTRASVTQLNRMVVDALLRAGLPATGLSPCGAWSTSARQLTGDGCDQVEALLGSGLVPVLHGDAVLDEQLGCTILSGDTVVRRLAEALRPQAVVFLTNVAGIYDRPPEEPGATLLREIEVDGDGAWRVAASSSSAAAAAPDSGGAGTTATTEEGSETNLSGRTAAASAGSGCGVRFAAARHDMTGGIETKVAEAAAVARLGIDVLIAKAGSEAGRLACLHGAAMFETGRGAEGRGGDDAAAIAAAGVGWQGTWVYGIIKPRRLSV